MTALVDFVNNNSVWFYVIGIVGILYGLKMLFDARRQSRTTIFSLEQEQAGEQSYRAVFVMFGFALFIAAAWGVNAFIAPNVPQQGSSFLRTPTTIPKVLILPTFTPIPSPTKEVPTPTRTVPPTRPPVTEPPVAPTVPGVVRPSTPTPAPALPAPDLIDPTDREIFIGENKANNAITFRWSWCDNCFNANTDAYIVTVSYTDRASNQPKKLTGQTRENILRLYDIIRGTGVDLYQTALDDLYTWNVYVLRNGAQAGARSQTFSFYWR